MLKTFLYANFHHHNVTQYLPTSTIKRRLVKTCKDANMLCSIRKYGFYATLMVVSCLLLMMYAQSRMPSERISLDARSELLSSHPVSGKKYLVNTGKCKIPNVDPWNSETKPLYMKKDYVRCSNKKKLTQIVYREGRAFLKIERNVKVQYINTEINCCYSNITRENSENPDLGISVSSCVPFNDEVELYESSVLVRCEDTLRETEIYLNTHAVLPKIRQVHEKIKKFKEKSQPPSILLIGIDSMSRLNFHRTLLKTQKYLNENNWLEYEGYNKVGDNTLPNLMALLTGNNLSSVLKECDPRDRVDKCNFIWKDFSKVGYITAYGEDEISISTFTTYSYKGFRDQPSDYYFIPYITASEQLLRVKTLDGMTYCAGLETSAERILNIAKDMVKVYPQHPKFGFFWMNSFSHDDINAPARVDTILLEFFSHLQRHISDNTIVVFFSDHGIRFGDIRLTRSGWLEERLPFLYFWIPDSFKRKFPNEARHLSSNSIKLTTPYDVYMTLQHVLVLYEQDYIIKQSNGCINCKSLFTRINDRSCEDVSIQFHYCTCFGYALLDTKSELVQTASEFAITDINSILEQDSVANDRCIRFVIKTTISAGISANNTHNKTFLLLIFETIPLAKYEVTLSVHYDKNGRYFVNEGSTSRLDKYEDTSSCVTEHKMYCYCKWNMEWRRNIYNVWFEI